MLSLCCIFGILCMSSVKSRADFTCARIKPVGNSYRYTIKASDVPIGSFLGKLSALADEYHEIAKYCPREYNLFFCYYADGDNHGANLTALSGKDLQQFVENDASAWPDRALAVNMSSNFREATLLDMACILAEFLQCDLAIITGDIYFLPHGYLSIPHLEMGKDETM